MKSYLAQAGLEKYLAHLPAKVEFQSPKRTRIVGEFGPKELDVDALNEPIHRKFVNWPSTPEGVLSFTQQFGLLDPGCQYSPEAVGERPEGSFSFSIRSWMEYQKYFQQYWDWNANHGDWSVVRHDLSNYLMYEYVPGRPEQSHFGLGIEEILLTGPRPLIVLFANSLWQYMCALLLFHSVGELRQCENPECPAPRFVAARKNQVFCSNDCAGLIAKRRWWAKHGKQWRKDRGRKKLKGGKR